MKKEALRVGMVFVIIGLCIGMGLSVGITAMKTTGESLQATSMVPVERRVIICTGFWNPTGQMLVPFCTDSELNPGGWQGENWEDRGYDIYSFFPKPGVYTGMFEVDYQDTLHDFTNVTGELHPFAIISFGAGAGPWEIEYNARNLGSWVNDPMPPYQPTPCPPDDTQPVGFVRHSSLPVQAIADAVNSQVGINAWVDWDGNPGAYLCEYIAYLGMWYHDQHNVTGDPSPCRAAGFIHVNAGVPVGVAMNATMVTLRETIDYLADLNIPPEAPDIDGETAGTVGEEYNYTFVTTDADTDMVSYYIEWGDGANSGWLGPFASGNTITESYIWDEKGTYTIKAKARDSFGAESTWGTLEVSMPTSSLLPMQQLWAHFFELFPHAFPLLRWFLGQ